MKRKCLYSILLILSMLCTCLTGAVAEEQRKIFTDGDYQYAVLDDVSVEIVKYNGKAKKLTIPDMLDGKEVIALDNHAFSNFHQNKTRSGWQLSVHRLMLLLV
mgnify:CR=1 FL=1